MSKQEDHPLIGIRQVHYYAAPCFNVLFYLTTAAIVLLFGLALYLLYMGFMARPPTNASSDYGWSQLLSMVIGLVFLFMSLVQILVLSALLRYRRFVYTPTISHVPLLLAGIVFLVNTALFFALTFIFFKGSFLVMIPALIYAALGTGWMGCYCRSLKYSPSDTDHDNEPISTTLK